MEPDDAITYLQNFRHGCETGVVPDWMALEVLLHKAAEWNVEIVLQHSAASVVAELMALGTAVRNGQTDEATRSWIEADDERTRVGVRRLAAYLSETGR